MFFVPLQSLHRTYKFSVVHVEEQGHKLICNFSYHASLGVLPCYDDPHDAADDGHAPPHQTLEDH